MFKIFNDNYYVDIDEIEKYINITSQTGGTELHINVIKYETVKIMLEVLMTEDELLVAFDSGNVTDGKTVAALFAWHRFRARAT